MKIAIQLFCLGLLCVAISAYKPVVESSEELELRPDCPHHHRPHRPRPPRCPKGQSWNECGSACANQCPGKMCTLQCVPGCYCPKGTMVDKKNPECCVSKDKVCRKKPYRFGQDEDEEGYDY